jgi:hypothetical protein
MRNSFAVYIRYNQIYVAVFKFEKLFLHCVIFGRMFCESAEWAKPRSFCGEGQIKCALSWRM